MTGSIFEIDDNTETFALEPYYPGQTLAFELAEIGVSAAALARRMKVPQNRITRILRGESPISADTAVRLGAVLGGDPGLWLRLQARADLQRAETALAGEAFEPAIPKGGSPGAAVRRAISAAE